MFISKYIPKAGPGLTATEILKRIPDHTAELEDVKEALRIAESDQRVWRIGNYYWGEK
jgi:hypothetical protein